MDSGSPMAQGTWGQRWVAQSLGPDSRKTLLSPEGILD